MFDGCNLGSSPEIISCPCLVLFFCVDWFNAFGGIKTII
jgi:hypothetical protein